MNDVQLSIADLRYANVLSALLAADGKHRIHILKEPNPVMDGVLVIDESSAGRMLAGEQIDLNRCVVFTRNESVDTDKLWNAGLRHLIPADSPPSVGRLVVLAAEMRLKAERANSEAAVQPELFSQRETDHELWEQLRDLRNAISDAVWNSGAVARAMNVLRRARREVQIEIDTVLVEAEREEAEWPVVPLNVAKARMSMFGPSDRTFLQKLGIREL